MNAFDVDAVGVGAVADGEAAFFAKQQPEREIERERERESESEAAGQESQKARRAPKENNLQNRHRELIELSSI